MPQQDTSSFGGDIQPLSARSGLNSNKSVDPMSPKNRWESEVFPKEFGRKPSSDLELSPLGNLSSDEVQVAEPSSTVTRVDSSPDIQTLLEEKKNDNALVHCDFKFNLQTEETEDKSKNL